MTFSFSKYSGCGNDFVLIDDREKTFPFVDPKFVANVCHRRFGVGADGVILLQTSDKADYRMRIFNADGSEAEMCGNGIRCLMKFIQEIGIPQSTCSIETLCRIHTVTIDRDIVKVEMGNPTHLTWDLELSCGEKSITLHSMDTGVPHAVEFVQDIQQIDLDQQGYLVRHHPLFSPKGTNYNAVQLLQNGMISIRTFERGVEGETLACGTGATAAALAAAKRHQLASPIEVKTRSGGILTIFFEWEKGHPKHIWMAGPAQKIYKGTACFDNFLS